MIIKMHGALLLPCIIAGPPFICDPNARSKDWGESCIQGVCWLSSYLLNSKFQQGSLRDCLKKSGGISKENTQHQSPTFT